MFLEHISQISFNRISDPVYLSMFLGVYYKNRDFLATEVDIFDSQDDFGSLPKPS
jgi:hypothetical protein